MKQTVRNNVKTIVGYIVVLTIIMIASFTLAVWQLCIVSTCVSYNNDNNEIEQFDYEYKKTPPMVRTMTYKEYKKKRNVMVKAQKATAEKNEIYAICLECKEAVHMNKVWKICFWIAVALVLIGGFGAIRSGMQAWRWVKKLGQILPSRPKNDSGKHYYSRGF